MCILIDCYSRERAGWLPRRCCCELHWTEREARLATVDVVCEAADPFSTRCGWGCTCGAWRLSGKERLA